MFYGSVRHHCKLNSVPQVWGTKWAPHQTIPASWGGTAFTSGRAALSPCWYLSGSWSSAIHLQLTPKCQEIMWSSSVPRVEGFLCLLDLQIFSSLCFSSYSTQANLRCFTLHLRTRLLLKTPFMCYTVRNLSVVSRGWALSLTCKCTQVSTVPPGLLSLLAVWKEQFLTPNSARSDMPKLTRALALTSWGESISRVFHQLKLWEEIPALVRMDFKMGRMLPLEVLISAACAEAAGACTLLQAEPKEIPTNSLSWEDDQERREKAEVSKPAGHFWSQKKVQWLKPQRLQVPACASLA